MTTSTRPVRVRFAPSPTGYLHVGGVRTLLFNWLYAQHATRKGGKGELILRIEDTDQARSTRESEVMVLDNIRQVGLKYVEGPDVGGPHAPYRQSERMAIFGEHARKLVEMGKAYPCFCSDDLITQKREAALKLGRTPHYDGTCARLTPEQVKAKVAAGEKAGLRFRVPPGTIVFEDLVRGRVEFKEGTVGDFFITRTPKPGESETASGIGMPVYNFSCVIDDHLMGMTHIIRAEEHLANTPKQIMLFQAFGWEVPQFAHVSLVLGTDRQKLSKRNGDVAINDYLDKGYLPEALLNFLVLLGWWPNSDFKPKSGHPEILSMDEVIEIFDPSGFQKSPGVFDVQKLKWMNGFYIKAMSPAELAKRARPYFETYWKEHPGFKPAALTDQWLEDVIAVVKGEVDLLSEIPAAAGVFFEDEPKLEDEATKALKEPTSPAVIDALTKELSALPEQITGDQVLQVQKNVGVTTGTKGKNLFMPVRAVTTGKGHGPELKLILPLLGKSRTLARIEKLRKQAGV